jgi:phosphopantetheine adenylyltransferase
MASLKDAALPSLLLLPSPPYPANRAALNAAYRPSLQSVISKLKALNEPDGAVLIIGLVSPVLHGSFRRQKSLSWHDAQLLLAGIYSIVSVVCTQLQVATDVNGGRGSVDARVVLIDYDSTKRIASDYKPAIEPNNTVVVDLGTFVSAYHPWNCIFSVGCEAGHQLLSTYLGLFEGTQKLRQDQLVVVDGGLTLKVSPSRPAQPSPPTSLYDVVCLGGTFDHLHPGHKLLLTAAILLLKVPQPETTQPCRFIIGITGDELLKNKKYAEYVQSWDDRAMYVIEFLSTVLELRKEGWKEGRSPTLVKKDGDITALFRSGTVSIECVRIQDAFGPTITTEVMDALVVSGETRSGGAAVNDRRKDLGWHPMEVFEVHVLDAEESLDGPTRTENFASKISSTAIRRQKAESHI